MAKVHVLHNCKRLLLAFGVLLMLTACQSDMVEPVVETTDHVIVPNVNPASLFEMQQFFTKMNYSWETLNNGVPPFILDSFPKDLNHKVRVSTKKRSFFLGLLPMVLLANQEIMAERQFLLKTLSSYELSHQMDETNRDKLARLVRKYRLRGDPLRDHRIRARLLNRVDTIPPALALAQAANESAWGTSRFARMGNNLFGQWTFKPGTGIVPEDRPDGATYEVQKFSSLYQSVSSYLLNLNTHGAYSRLRSLRSSLRQQGKPITGMLLANGLTKYSVRGDAYVDELNAMITQNQLTALNAVRLRLPTAEILSSSQAAGSGLLSSRRYIGGRSSTAWGNPEMGEPVPDMPGTITGS